MLLVLLSMILFATADWPSPCSGPIFSSQNATRLLGNGGAGPVSLGQMSFRASWRACNNTTGCGSWSENFDYTSEVCQGSSGGYNPSQGPTLALRVLKGQLQVISLAGRTDASQCNGGSASVSQDLSLAVVDYDSGCCSINAGSDFHPMVPFLVQGAITDDCVALFSKTITVGPDPNNQGDQIETRFFLGGPISYPNDPAVSSGLKKKITIH